MCGIAGIFRPKGAKQRDGSLAAMVGLMHHRGPDGEGHFATPDGLFELGFRRLSIIDLETGGQPLEDRQGAMVLAGNGEVYNYLELRKKYAAYPYKTMGDMETVLAAFEASGDGFLDELNGMYALALFDQREHRLRLVRDRLGVKPLYYAALADGTLVFASEIKPLFASGLVRPEIDEAAVSAYLAHGYVPAPATLFRNIRKVPPAHMLVVEAGGRLDCRRYWRAEGKTPVPAGAEELAEYLNELLDDSVRLQMRSDVPVGTLLSGGIDSGLIVALAARHTEGALNTFTVKFEGAAVDEAPLARQVAERYATRHQEIRLGTGDATALLPKLAWYTEEPINDAALVPNYLVEHALGRRITVALNGTGGDELFAGYGRYFQKPVEAGLMRLPAWLRQGIVEPTATLLDSFRGWQLARAGKFDTDPGGYLHDHSTHFPPPLRDLIGNAMPVPAPAQRAFADAFDGPRQSRMLYADINTYLPDDLLTLLDRTAMAVSVEGRVPFLDHRLVEAALSVTPDARTPGDVQKALERRIAARLLPDAVLCAPKQGFASPVPAWMTAGMGRDAERLLTRKRALERGWWTEAGIARLCRDPARHGFRVYTLLMLELAVLILGERPLGDAAPDVSLADLVEAA